MRVPESLALRLLHLEQQIESYARLHAEELAGMRATLNGLKDEMLAMYQRTQESFEHPPSDDEPPARP
ncbi:MAG: hypothetical protein KGS47_12755 [Chloroflexi bacterium]|jgi:phage shock protein A|nr:hypothetical protein [Chloroflexota bacterium]